MTLLDERSPFTIWGAGEPTVRQYLPEFGWDEDDVTRPHPEFAVLRESPFPVASPSRSGYPRRAELRNTPPKGNRVIDLRDRPGPVRDLPSAPASPFLDDVESLFGRQSPERAAASSRRAAIEAERTGAIPVVAPAPPAARITKAATGARGRRRPRTGKAIVIALVIAADTFAAVTLAGPPAVLDDAFTSSPDVAPDALRAAAVLQDSDARAQSALALRTAGDRAGRSLTRTSAGKAEAAVGQAVAYQEAVEAAERAREEALREARENPRALAKIMVADRGWSSAQYSCLNRLWMRESGWNYRAQNPSSGAYGIPQSLPGSKMGTVDSDWRTNPVTQITWGLNYIADRYGSPCAAWGHSESVGWY